MNAATSGGILAAMSEVTRILEAIQAGDPKVAADLLPLVYGELRKLAAAKLANEQPGQTLDATGLVHEAYLRLVDQANVQPWNSRGHFFAAAAEAMRRILVENARRKRAAKRGGGRPLQGIDGLDVAAPETPVDLVALDEALSDLTLADSQAAELVNLRYFGGLTIKEAAEFLGVSPRTADSLWAYARAWLLERIQGDRDKADGARPVEDPSRENS
jgi:RNA polymerase sigma factor (TIGR02999 family)